MSNEGWIKFEDEMPKLNQEVKIKFFDGSVSKVTLCKKYDEGIAVDFILFNEKDGQANLGITIGWLPITEKRPDFGKLNKDDILILTYGKYNTNTYPIKFHSMNDSYIFTSHTGNYDKNLIKKIIRINIETHEFEEI